MTTTVSRAAAGGGAAAGTVVPVDIHELDATMRASWPPLHTVRIGGWQAGLSEGFTRRGNSVLPVGPVDHLGEAVDAVERLYARHGQPAVFHIGRDVAPPGLDAALADRGYVVRDPTQVLARAIETPQAGLGNVSLRGRPDAPWLDLWWAIDRGAGDAGRADPRRVIAERLLTGATARYASATDAAGTVAVGRAVTRGGTVGLSCLAVRPDARRRGHGQQVVLALLGDAAGRGASAAWLQVTERNTAAQELYAGLGFAPFADYRYRERATTAA